MGINPFDPKTHPNCHSGHEYALKVISGELPNCVYIVGACKRYLSDLEATNKEDSPYIFDVENAERYLRLVQKFEHVIGDDWATKNITYEPWQNWVWMNILGFAYRDNPKNPKYRTCHIEVPRGNAKSAMASQCVLFFVALDRNVSGNKIATFATKSDQARIVLDSARAMAAKNKSYLKSTGVDVLAHKIVHESSFSEVTAMSSDSKSMDGLNLRVAVCDELHAMSRELFDVIVSGQKKRKDSITLCISTAGYSLEGVGHAQSQYARQVALGKTEDETFFSAVYTIDDNDDIYSKAAWRKSNPNFGVSVDAVAFEATAKKAKEVPSDLPNFKVKHLNIWLSEAHAYYDTNKWDECADPTLNIENFKGKPCKVGVDIASRIDLTSIAYLFKEKDVYYLFDKSYLPEDRLREVNSSMYNNCVGNGHLISTKGEAINQDQIRDEILDSSKLYKISEILCDPWNTLSLMQQLQTKRLNVTEFRMTVANLSEATKTLDELIRKGKIRHNGSPLLKWCLGNVVAKEDANGNVYPRKTHERLKIDPIVALLMALASQIQDEKKMSVYDVEKRGLRFI